MSVGAVIEAIGRGELAIVADDHQRENEGDLIVAADAVSEEKIAFFLEHTSGLICVSLTGERCDSLRLPAMVDGNDEAQGTAFTVSTDAREGITTGISAADRALTITALGDPAFSDRDFVRPGHVFPLRARPAGTLERPGHTEASLDLTRIAGRNLGGVLCEVTSRDRRRMATAGELEELSRRFGLPLCSVGEIVEHRMHSERLVAAVAESRIGTPNGSFACQAWRSELDGIEHLALVRGDPSGPEPCLVRVHSECLTGEAFGSQRCDCGSQLADSMRAIADAGRGALIYLRGHEGRGIGIGAKLAAYRLQDEGYDTVDANLALGMPVDSREYGLAAQILLELGVQAVRLMTNNPGKADCLRGYGLELVEQVPLPVRVTAENCRYLKTKQERLGHRLEVWEGAG